MPSAWDGYYFIFLYVSGFVEIFLTTRTTSGAHTLPVAQDGRVGRASLPVTLQAEKSGDVAICTFWAPLLVAKA